MLCRPSVTVVALLDHHVVSMMVAVVTPAPVPTVIMVHPGVRAMPAVVMAAFDHDRMGVGR